MTTPNIRAALARWGHPAAPPAPEPEEVGELVVALGSKDRWTQLTDAQLDRAATLLQQLSAPAPAVAPVAVAERLPGPEDCDAEGRFWAWCTATHEWCLLDRWHYREEQERNAPGWKSGWPYWLPFYTLPLPAEEVE